MKRKLPHFRFPGFKILDRYILGKFLSTYFFAIAMIIVVVVIFDYVEKIDNFTETKAPLKAIIFDYYLNFIPFFINQFSGLFTFIAVIFFTSKMAYQTEVQSRNQAVVGPTIYHPHVRFARCGNFHATPQSGHTH